jgi:DNA oxidative demethylase
MNLAIESIRESLGLDVQGRLVEQVRAVCKASPLVQPVARGGQPMSVRVTSAGRFGWVGAGEYRYSEVDSRGRPWPSLPAEWGEIANRVAGDHPWDCAIVNWYGPDANLGEHRDLGERYRTRPIVTISLGDAASWTVRLDEHGPVHRCRLESGDVTVLAGPTRLALHSVERVIACPMFSPLAAPGRISITMRVAG